MLELHVLGFNSRSRRLRPFFDINVDPLRAPVAEVISCQSWPNHPTEISKFLGLGEPYGQTVPATGQLWLWGFLHIEEDVKLHILSGGGINPGGSWVLGAL